MTIAQELVTLNAAKTAIAAAIEAKGGNISALPFLGYADAITALNTSGSGGGSTLPLEWSESYYQSVLAEVGTYQRPRDWLTLPTMVDGDSKFIGLLAVYPNSNYIAFTAAGNYTVNWGDGAVENFAANVDAQRNISFAAPALDGTNAPVTIATNGTFTRADHGRAEGERISLYSVTGVTEVVNDEMYYVRDVTTNSFKLSLTAGGAAITFASAGTAALLPYKQAIVQLTPQAGQTLTKVDLQRKHAAVTAGNANFLDIKVGGPSITTLKIGSTDVLSGTQTVAFGLLEQIEVYKTNVSHGGFQFYSLGALKNIKYFNASSFTSMSNAFSTCYSLEYVNIQNSQNVTDMGSLFNACYSLKTVPLFDTSKTLYMNVMFGNCRALKTYPLFNTAAVTNMSSVFQNCYSLQAVPLFNTATVTNMSSMFYGCSSLQAVPLFSTAAVINMSSMFYGCCTLQTVPLFSTATVANMSSMFQNCYSLQAVPLFNTAAVTNMSSMFQNCYSLQTIPELNLNAVTLVTSFVTGCRVLSRISFKNMKQTLSIASCGLDAAALDELYTNLPTVTAKTLTVTGNPGVTGDNPSIATAKGWTVIG